MKLSDAVEGFLLAREGDSRKDLSPRTIELYRNNLGLLIERMADPELEDITSTDLSNFMTWLERGYRPRRKGCDRLSGHARDNYWKAIRSFYNWAERELKIKRVDDNLPRPVFVEEEIIPFSRREVETILDACRYTREANTHGRRTFKMRRPTEIRDHAIVLTLLETGIRLGELSRLKMVDVNLEVGEIYIKAYRTGIKSRPRTIPIARRCKIALWKYRSNHRLDASPGDRFFDLAYHSVQSVFHNIEVRTGVEVYAHKFRHTFAIQYLRNGGDVFTLQRILGHSTLRMVRRYLAIAQSDVKDAHRRASPVDRWNL